MNAVISQDQFNRRPLPIESIVLAQQLILLPLYFFVPLWISLLSIIAAFSVWYSTKNQAFQLHKWLKVGVTFVAIVGILIAFKKFSGKEAGVSLITAMYGLKILEIRSRRDANLLLSLGFFMLVAGFLFSQKPIIALYQVVPVIAILNAFVALNSLDATKLTPKPLINTFKELGRYLALALPIMIIMFLFFPRLGGPIWRMPGTSSAISGVSDSMSPGEISSLQLFDKVAFRASFGKTQPPETDLYWRLLVLDSFDGLTWTRAGARRIEDLASIPEELTVFDYSITLEPTQLSYLVTLDRPIKTPLNAGLVTDFTTYTRYRVQDRIRYAASSVPSLLIDRELSQSSRTRYTELPTAGNERSRDWAQKQRQTMTTDWDFVRSLLLQINRQSYFYTLQPPIMDEDTVDSFWFDKQKGFCEHYASALVFMARAAGVPARVVVGYQGGDKNPLSDYWIVRYANAHAWTEIWFEDRGWVRIDPTAAIAASRVEQNLLGDYRQRDSLFDDFDVVDLDDIGFWKQLDFWMDEMNSNWNDWILDYDSQRQHQLFSNWGLKGISDYQLIAGMIILVGLFLAFASFRWLSQRNKRDPLRGAFESMLRGLQKKGLLKQANTLGPNAIAQLLANEDPSGFARHIEVIEAYVSFRYREEPHGQSEYQSLVSRLRKL